VCRRSSGIGWVDALQANLKLAWKKNKPGEEESEEDSDEDDDYGDDY